MVFAPSSLILTNYFLPLNEALCTIEINMIELTSNGIPDIEITIQKDTDSNRQSLVDLKRHEKLGDGVDLIYIYSLDEGEVAYPKENGSVLYIGEAGRQKKTGTRFNQHISTGETVGGDTGTNYTLSYYYWSGKKLRLKIFLLVTKNNSKARKDIESQLFQAHLKKYGAHPIAQGASGESYRVSAIENLVVPEILEGLINA